MIEEGLVSLVVGIDELYPDPGNVRTHDERNMQAITSSLRRFGQQKPIVATEDGQILAGNGTWEAAKGLGWSEIAVMRTSLSGIDAVGYAVADNRSSELAEWDVEGLGKVIRELEEGGLGVLDVGFEEGEIDRLIETLQEPEVVEPEPVEPLDPDQAQILVGDVVEQLKTLPAASVHCVVTSPPYWGLRDYGTEGQGGLEETPEEHVDWIVGVFREIRRVLRPDGTAWVNYGDSYAGGGGYYPDAPSNKAGSKSSRGAGRAGVKTKEATGIPPGLKNKDLCGMPWRVAFALQADGWYLRSDIIWSKPNPMPESVTDRPTKAHEYIFLLAHPDSGGRYFFDADAVREEGTRYEWNSQKFKGGDLTKHHGSTIGKEEGDPDTGRNLRDVWHIATQPYAEAHFATYPETLIEPCVKAGCDRGGVVLDPFNGSGTTGVVALRNGCRYIGIELNPEYAELAHRRISESLENTTE